MLYGSIGPVCGGVLDGAVGGNVTTYMVTDLAANTTYDFQVQALDGAGNTSANGPTITATTEAGGQGITDQDVLDALQPTCSACHSGWFASVQDFQTHVSNNGNVVIHYPLVHDVYVWNVPDVLH